MGLAGQELPSAEPLPRVDDEQMDYFDRQDLGHLRRRLRTAGECYARERSLYLDLVQQFFEVGPCMQSAPPLFLEVIDAGVHGRRGWQSLQLQQSCLISAMPYRA